jgi:hypothetical protein
MINNKQLYTMAESVGLSRMAFYHRAQREGLTIPLSYQEFKKIALDVATSTRINDTQRRAILNLVKSETSVSEPEHLPFFRSPKSNPKVETRLQEESPKVDFEISEPPMFSRAEPETKILEEEIFSEPKYTASGQSVSAKAEEVETSNLTYAQTAGNSIRKMNAFVSVLMFISMMGVSYTLYTVGTAFFNGVYVQIVLGCLAVWAAWSWEGALKEQTNAFMHQLIYKMWGGWGGFGLSTIVLLTMLAPNIYQGVVAAKKLAFLAAPVHIEDDGTGINDRLIKEKDAIAANYQRHRQTLKQEQETAALADPMVAKFAGYERSERNTAAARRGEAEKYRKKGERSNMNWCLHLAKQAEKKAETWRIKKEQASASVYASYAALFTKTEQEEKNERQKADSRYQALLADHGKSESQLRQQSERQNEGIMWIGLIFLPIADFVVLLLIFLKVSYFYRTGQVDPSLKEYKVGEKSKLEQFLSGVVGPAWDTVFGQLLRVGYHYQAMAQASLDRAEFVKKLKAKEAGLRVQQYEQKIAQRIAELEG